MKAIILEKPGSFRSAEVAEAAQPAPGEALVRVHRVGICGTDYSGYLGKMPFYSYPRIPGHELGVEVLAVGEGVVNVKSGDRCSVEPYINCQECSACRRGATNCCENLRVLGVHTDGGLRPRFILPARKLHASASLAWEQLALVETLAIGCHAVNRGSPRSDETVLVIGAGPIGLSVLQFARLAGARTIVLDINQQRLAFCKSTMGADHTVVSGEIAVSLKAIIEANGGELPNVVIDATGNSKCMSTALEYVGFAGRLVFVGITTQEIRFEHPLMHRREMTLLASRNALPPDFTKIIKAIEDRRIDTNPWITHRADIDQMIGEFPKWLKPENGVIKAMVSLG